MGADSGIGGGKSTSGLREACIAPTITVAWRPNKFADGHE